VQKIIFESCILLFHYSTAVLLYSSYCNNQNGQVNSIIIMQRQREERESNTTTTQLSLPAGGYQSSSDMSTRFIRLSTFLLIFFFTGVIRKENRVSSGAVVKLEADETSRESISHADSVLRYKYSRTRIRKSLNSVVMP
jgi:hypothetical protein